jgi:hypothetical protein
MGLSLAILRLVYLNLLPRLSKKISGPEGERLPRWGYNSLSHIKKFELPLLRDMSEPVAVVVRS